MVTITRDSAVTMKFIFGKFDCTLESGVGTGDHLSQAGDFTRRERAHVSPGIDWKHFGA